MGSNHRRRREIHLKQGLWEDHRGDVATYIPELANVDSQRFGIAIVDAQGRVATGGDADMPFSIQSISKVFTLTLALGMAVGKLVSRR